jgi:16S rRNA (cytosine967-C5)-methyltransferase
VNIQRQVIEKSIRFLKADSLFFYITCSVFRKENEEQVEFTKAEGLTLIQSELLSGHRERADTLFIAVFRK